MATAQPAKAGDEFKLILPLLRTPLKQGDTWYPVGRKWWQSWCDYVGVDPEFLSSDRDPDVKASAGDKPKGIDTKSLKADGVDHAEISKTAQEHTDFEWVPAAAYDLFTAWYGLSAGSLSFPRKVITVGLQQLERIDMYPSFLTLLFTDKTGEPDTATKRVEAVSGNTPLNFLLDKYAPKKEKDGKEDANNKREGRVWIREKAKKDKDGKDSKDAKQPGWKLLEAGETKQKIETYEFAPLAEVMLEYQNAEGKFVRPEPVKKNWREFEIGDVLDAKDTQGKWYQSEVKFIRDKDIQVHFIGWPSNWDEWIPKDSQDRLAPKYTHCQEAYQSKSNSMGDMFTRQNSMGAPVIRGAVGLRNLGNTCFMNSTLQCLSNTPGLTDYFMENKHLGEINRDNALGWGGKVAEAYGELLHEIWGGQYSTVAPRNFKQVIGEFQPRFSGYQQHDSSELLSFLMDGLHEDLNRVKKKPPTQAVDSKGRPDTVVAKESWDRHLLRNKSVIVDQCQGQLKSRVVCPDCKKDSITFDPFMFLSVPLPQVTDRIQEVIFISSRAGTGDSTPKTYGIKVNKSAAVSDIKAGLATLLGSSKPGAMLVCEVWSNRLFKVFPHDSPVNRIQPKDEIWVFEVPELAENAASDQKDQKDPNEKPQENYISLQVTNQAIDKAKKKGTARMAGWPFVVAVPESKIKAMPVVELRKILHDAVTPFLKGGWQQGETDESLYSIHLMDKSGHEHIMDVPMKDDQKVDLTTQTGRAGFSFCLLWDEAQMAKRYWDGKTVKDKSAGDEDSGKKGLSVYDCMQAFTTQEVLRPGDEWYCPDCKKHQCASKKFDLWHLPDVLVVHLKRFNYNRMWRDKLDNLVDFPIEGLNLYDYVVNPEEKKNSVYDLYAVSNHFGGLGGGHYTAYAKNLIDKKWYNLDDSSVSPVQPSTVVTSAAYVLFYIRRGVQKGQSVGTKGTGATKGA